MTRRAEWFTIIAAFAFFSLVAAGTQAVDHERAGFGDGGAAYHAMATSAMRGHPLQEAAPFVYRPAMPLLVAALGDNLDWVIRTGFARLNLGFNLLSVVLLALLLQRHVSSALARLAVIVAFLIEPHSPVRLAYYHPVTVDVAAMTWALAGLLGVDWFERRPSIRRSVALAVVTAVGVSFHELALLPAICLFAARIPGAGPSGVTWRDRWAAWEANGVWIPLLTGLAVSAAIRVSVMTIAPPASQGGWLIASPAVARYLLAWALVFGPLLVLLLLRARRTAAFLASRKPLLVYGAVLAGVALLSGGDAERWLVFASPTVWIAIAFALGQLAPGSLTGAGAVLLIGQALWSRLGLPLASNDVLVGAWGPGWTSAAAALSYGNLWSESVTPRMAVAYAAAMAVSGAAGYVALKWRDDEDEPQPALGAGVTMPQRSLAKLLSDRVPAGIMVAGGAVLAMVPVVWLATRHFYWTDYARPGVGYLVYNLARLWMLVVLVAVFWATGTRIIRRTLGSPEAPESALSRSIEPVLCGAAAWAIATVILAACGLYYVWVVLPLLAIASGFAMADLTTMIRSAPASSLAKPVVAGWGLVATLLKFLLVFNVAALLLTIALWGNPGPDNDVPGNYLPYYESVLQAHGNAANGYWVHYFVSKGHGLAFLVNILSDVQGAALASFLLILLGGAMIWRLALPASALIGIAGFALYLQFHAEQGAYAKGHIVRNTLIACLILSFAKYVTAGAREGGLPIWPRNVLATAILLLSPLAAVLLVPLFCFEAMIVAVVRDAAAARRHVMQAAWSIAVTAAICFYNFMEVGLLELHSMPSFAGGWVSISRLSAWMDPGLAYVDERMAFIQRSLTGAVPPVAVGFTATQSFREGLVSMLNPAALTLLAGAAAIVGVALVWSRVAPAHGEALPGQGRSNRNAAAVGAGYLFAILLWLAAMRMFGGGPGSSMGRFTDFITPLGIALGVLLLTVTWRAARSGPPRRVLAAAIALVFAVAFFRGAPPVLAQLWASSVDFFIGKSSYAAMYDGNWQTETARRIAVTLPPGARAELLNFLPGFAAIPATPFQRPDGNVYLKDYTRVIYAEAGRGAELYAAVNINHFLIDVSGRSPLVWSGFAPLFAPESIRSRLRIASHTVTAYADLYLLTWNDGSPAGGDEFEAFLEKWTALRASERRSGQYRTQYVNGAAALAAP